MRNIDSIPLPLRRSADSFRTRGTRPPQWPVGPLTPHYVGTNLYGTAHGACSAFVSMLEGLGFGPFMRVILTEPPHWGWCKAEHQLGDDSEITEVDTSPLCKVCELQRGDVVVSNLPPPSARQEAGLVLRERSLKS